MEHPGLVWTVRQPQVLEHLSPEKGINAAGSTHGLVSHFQLWLVAAATVWSFRTLIYSLYYGFTYMGQGFSRFIHSAPAIALPRGGLCGTWNVLNMGKWCQFLHSWISDWHLPSDLSPRQKNQSGVSSFHHSAGRIPVCQRYVLPNFELSFQIKMLKLSLPMISH